MGRVSLLRLASNDVMAITKCRILATPVNQFTVRRRCPAPVCPHQFGKGEAMKLNDDDIVTWVCHGQRNTSTVAAARKMLRAAYSDWFDDKIEQELFALIVSKGRA
jgi:hypothetical protein